MVSDYHRRHLGPTAEQTEEMLAAVGVSTLDALIDSAVPQGIRLSEPLDLKDGISEQETTRILRALASQNKVYKSFIGLGYFNTYTPAPIQRHILENPGWYTQYTPYQAEISQGRLEALLNFQTMVSDLTGLPIANASLLDEATAAAEAMMVLYRSYAGDSNRFFVSENTLPQTVAVLQTRAEPMGVKIVIGSIEEALIKGGFFGALLNYPNRWGEIQPLKSVLSRFSEQQIPTVVCSDLMALVVCEAPGTLGADIVVGNSQRFGVPLGFGGPHAAFFACKSDYMRQIPGRIIGVSKDRTGKLAYRMALQTREQHIRRDKATSNICTAQALLAIMAGMYAVYHGKDGLQHIATTIHTHACLLESLLKHAQLTQLNTYFFDTISYSTQGLDVQGIQRRLAEKQINVAWSEDVVSIALDETATFDDVLDIAWAFTGSAKEVLLESSLAQPLSSRIGKDSERKTDFLSHPVFSAHHSETNLLRYIKRLESKDLSLTTSMIPLGSCTMKLNPAAGLMPVSWPEFAAIHPFAPKNQVSGYIQLIEDLEKRLAVVTGLEGVSLQPNSGAQGEYAGLLAIRYYFKSLGQDQRDVALIPSSAHGTNPASAVMAGFKVVVVKCDENGNIDFNDLEAKVLANKDRLGALLVTYPSTHGVFEEKIKSICDLVHQYGGQVYMDGANMNAQVGITSPKTIGADVCHLNLHKTFSIPHGGGGPGMGPICVASHLVPFLPKHPIWDQSNLATVSAAPFGSPAILCIPYFYCLALGGDGMTRATEVAILNANYLKAKLSHRIPVLFTNDKGFVAHELILDFREIRKNSKIEVEDIAKRLMDFGFHSPTMSWPVAHTLMVEPTESEDKSELDRFADALLKIMDEIDAIQSGVIELEASPLRNAPHPQSVVIQDEWDRSYTRREAAFPLKYLEAHKFWPSVSRIDNAYGDRNLMCTCVPLSDYED